MNELESFVKEKVRKLALLKRRMRIRQHAIENQRTPRNLLERALWAVAKWSPFGGMAVPADFSYPYLLRTYLTPDGMRLHLPGKVMNEKDYGVGAGARPYLHFFFRGDGDRELHSHPWRVSYSLILVGGYIEYKWNPKTKVVEKKVYKPWSFNVLRHDDFHRVELLDKRGCWTLFVSVDRLAKSDDKDWGFLDVATGKYMPWGEYKGTVTEDV